MSNENLRSELIALHDKMKAAIHKEPLDKDVLGHVMHDLVRVAQGEQLKDAEGETLKEQLEDRAADFEVRHPRLAAILRDVMDVLSKLGI